MAGQSVRLSEAGLLGLGVTVLLAPLVVALLRRRRILDHPNHRSSHELPTPRGGGVAPAVGASVAVLVGAGSGPDRAALVACAALFGVLGLAEDLHTLPALRRLGLQALLAVALLPLLLHGWTAAMGWAVLFGAGVALWLVAFTNVFNFMDGINGLAAAQVLVAGGTWAYLGISTHHRVVALAGIACGAAAVGFLPFNFPRARVFLGDVGSYFLGAWLAAAAVVGVRAGLPPEAVGGPLALFGVDAAWTLVGRIRRGEVWYQSHRSHAYQRLIDLGWSHALTTCFVAATMGSVGALGLMSTTGSVPARVVADVLMVVVLGGYLAVPAYESRLAARGAVVAGTAGAD